MERTLTFRVFEAESALFLSGVLAVTFTLMIIETDQMLRTYF